MRKGMRRSTRLTSAFSTKAKNHVYAVALHFLHYNFWHTDETQRMPPAMGVGLTTRPWEVTDLVALAEAAEQAPKKRGPYNARKSDNSN